MKVNKPHIYRRRGKWCVTIPLRRDVVSCDLEKAQVWARQAMRYCAKLNGVT